MILNEAGARAIVRARHPDAKLVEINEPGQRRHYAVETTAGATLGAAVGPALAWRRAAKAVNDNRQEGRANV